MLDYGIYLNYAWNTQTFFGKIVNNFNIFICLTYLFFTIEILSKIFNM